MDRVIIALEADRLTVASILVKNKYTVRQGSELRPGTKSYDYYLEFERKPKYLCVKAGTDTNAGGNSSKTRQEQRDCVAEMKRRWGKYFDYNFKNNKPAIKVQR